MPCSITISAPVLLRAHVHACVHYGHDPPARILAGTLMAVLKQFFQEPPPLVGAKFLKKPLDLLLKQDHEHQQAYAHELVEDSAYQPHAEDLGGHNPHHDEREHAEEYVDRARLLHEPVQVEQQQRHDQYVESVFDSERCHGTVVYNGEVPAVRSTISTA